MTYLTDAASALRHARSFLPLGSTNRGINPNFLKADTQLTLSRFEMKDASSGGHDFRIEWLERLAGYAMVNGAGNCEELTAVAWKYLKRQVVPMHWMYMPKRWDGDIDHHYVLINASHVGTLVRDPLGHQLQNPHDVGSAHWGNAAVICDPWFPYSGLPPTAGPGALFYQRPAVSVHQFE